MAIYGSNIEVNHDSIYIYHSLVAIGHECQ